MMGNHIRVGEGGGGGGGEQQRDLEGESTFESLV